MVSDSQSKVYCPHCFGAWESMWWGILLPESRKGGGVHPLGHAPRTLPGQHTHGIALGTQP